MIRNDHQMAINHTLTIDNSCDAVVSLKLTVSPSPRALGNDVRFGNVDRSESTVMGDSLSARTITFGRAVKIAWMSATYAASRQV